MSYTLIKGTFRAVKFQPDGDSIRFAPDDVELVNSLPNAYKKIEPGQSVQLRLECIDALETHYTSGSSLLSHQPWAAATAARGQLLTLLGFEDVKWDDKQTNVTSVKADDRPGYILTNTFDTHGSRPVAYAFSGNPPVINGVQPQDGDEVFLTPQWVTSSANYRMVETGYAYPMYYEGAFHDIRAKFQAAVEKAQAAQGGPNNVWTTDVTQKGFSEADVDSLATKLALWPKMFRRLSNYFKDNPSGGLAGFPTWLENNRDNCFNLETGSWTALHNFVTFDGKKLRMTQDPLTLLFQG